MLRILVLAFVVTAGGCFGGDDDGYRMCNADVECESLANRQIERLTYRGRFGDCVLVSHDARECDRENPMVCDEPCAEALAAIQADDARVLDIELRTGFEVGSDSQRQPTQWLAALPVVRLRWQAAG